MKKEDTSYCQKRGDTCMSKSIYLMLLMTYYITSLSKPPNYFTRRIAITEPQQMPLVRLKIRGIFAPFATYACRPIVR